MKQPFRVAIIGRSDSRVDALLAGLSLSIHPRRFAAWDQWDPLFDPELIVVLPGTETCPPHPLPVPILPLGVEDLNNPLDSLESKLFQHRTSHPEPQSRLLGGSPAMAKVRGILTSSAKTELPILMCGENGTGKDLAALVAHEVSARANQAFVAVNCGAIPVGLAESELFGCVRGAFTGAENRSGYCQQARGGTLFLDEVGEMPPEIQSKMLRVLENKEIRRVGASRTETADFRLICATNRDLAADVKAGRFREDLYYRVNVLSLRMPPLRERKEDLQLLSDHFLENEASALNRKVKVGARAIAKMTGYHWPGNLRQLRNVVLRAAVLHDHTELGPDHIEWDN